jgi:hypothetical protein
VQELSFIDSRMRLLIWPPKAIAAELLVIDCITKVSSVAPVLLTRRMIILDDTLVNHVPDETSLQARLGWIPTIIQKREEEERGKERSKEEDERVSKKKMKELAKEEEKMF